MSLETGSMKYTGTVIINTVWRNVTDYIQHIHRLYFMKKIVIGIYENNV